MESCLRLRTSSRSILAIEVMRWAGQVVCRGLEIGVAVSLERGARYRDKRPVAKEMWAAMMRCSNGLAPLPEGELP
jgi:hypothetical protein